MLELQLYLLLLPLPGPEGAVGGPLLASVLAQLVVLLCCHLLVVVVGAPHQLHPPFPGLAQGLPG